MKIKFLSLSICCFTVLSIFAQSHGLGNHGIGPQTIGHGLGSQTFVGHRGSVLNDSANTTLKQKVLTIDIKATNDSVYYLNVTKRNGWPVGVGKPLKKSDLSHIPVYFKLSNKNAAGHWTVMRAYSAYGNLTTNHNCGTYLVNQNDDTDKGANKDWVDKLRTVCQWEFVSNADGKEVFQERALDQNNNIVFCYNIVKVSENKQDGSSTYAGSYTDAFAKPIFMRTDSAGDYRGYANFVQFKRDKRGYEVLFAFTDENGKVRQNKDGAYQTRKEYDRYGGQSVEASLDMVGNQMIDDFGNCGWRDERDAYGCILKAFYFDKDNKPIKMINNRNSSQVYGYEFKHDKYHRQTDCWYLDSLGHHGTDEYGAYHTICQYNSHGDRTLICHYDKNGKLVGTDQYGIAKAITEVNDKGYLTLVEWRDANESLVNGYNDYCKQVSRFAKDGTTTLSQIEYQKDKNDSLIISFEYVSDGKGNEVRYWPKKGYYRVDSVDEQGRFTLEAWYDLHDNPIPKPAGEDEPAWHKHTCTYDDVNHLETAEWLNEDGKPYVNVNDASNTYNKDIFCYDSTTRIITNTQYLRPFGLAQTFQKQLDEEGNIIAQWDITPYGEQARVGWWNNLHYKCKVGYTIYGEMQEMVGVNEFDEPAYLVSLNENGEVYYYSDLENYYDEDMHIIPWDSMETFKANLPKAFCVEVTDTAIAYPLGLRNGDIILSYGDWSISEDLRSNVNYFYLETILKAAESKSIVILRHNLASRTSTVIKLRDLPSGKLSDLGFYPHMIYYTKREKARLQEACRDYGFAYGSETKTGDKEVLMAVQIKGGLVQTRFYHWSTYDFKDPGFLLSAKETYSAGADLWQITEDDIDSWNANQMFRSGFKGKTELVLTQDFTTIKELSKSGTGNRGLRMIPILISNEMYNKLVQCYTPAPQEEQPQINSKNLRGTWRTFMKEDDALLNIELTLNKSQKASLKTYISYSSVQETALQVDLSLTLTATGKWTLDNNLRIDYKTTNFFIDNIDIRGVSDEERQQYINLIKENQDEFLDTLFKEYGGILCPRRLAIKSLKPQSMTVKIDGNTIEFTKSKK